MGHAIVIMLALLAALVFVLPGEAAEDGWFMPELSRFRGDAGMPPVPQVEITRKDYVEFLRPYAAGFESGQDHGPYGPRHVLPALAVYAYEGNPKLGEGIKQTLKHYADWVHATIKKEGGVFSEEGAGLCAYAFRELRKRGQMTAEDEQWAKDLLLALRQYQCAWRPGDGYWRGQHHRSQAQGMNHALAAAFYPQEPDAAKWKAYAAQVWSDWWDFRDVGINDTSYFFGSLQHILCTADLLERKEVFTDPQVQEILWKRLLYETTPDGGAFPYGPHGGFHSIAGTRIYALELASKYTRDGRYRWVAHRMLNYAQARGGFAPGHAHISAVSVEMAALASIICDDTVKPAPPAAGSQLLMRKEVLRLTDAQVKKLFPDAGGCDCNMYMSQKLMPSKLAFRTGWNPDDMFMFVECFARHDPLNPTAIFGLQYKGSLFAVPMAEKFVAGENMVRINDLSGQATFCGKTGTDRPADLPVGYEAMEVSVPDFTDHASASHATVKVTNFMGYKADHQREFLFVKNRFVLVRDETRFDDTFRGRVGPVWNTQNIAPMKGESWLNTWYSGHWFQNVHMYTNPNWDLLLYHAPHPDRKLTVTGRWKGEAIEVPYSTQYAWEGDITPGLRLQFVEVLLPHAPMLDATPVAAGITVLRDEPGLAAVQLLPKDGQCEWAVMNPDGKPVTIEQDGGPVAFLTTDARALYLRCETAPGAKEGEEAPTIHTLLVIDGSVVEINGEGVFKQPKRGTAEQVRKGG